MRSILVAGLLFLSGTASALAGQDWTISAPGQTIWQVEAQGGCTVASQSGDGLSGSCDATGGGADAQVRFALSQNLGAPGVVTNPCTILLQADAGGALGLSTPSAGSEMYCYTLDISGGGSGQGYSWTLTHPGCLDVNCNQTKSDGGWGD
ncbi:hypothetical protein ACFOGJ_00540 [Marinibaculum pumilum]|uniref:Uncharacterized protein n=1 Tax=Marinibaculum pumilum TaxID=1766165 RepID=A0ABV7KTI6_9PROT